MPGYEVYDDKEKQAAIEVFDEGGILMAHGFAALRKKFHVRELEDVSRKYFGVEYCQAVTSGTSALKIALKSVGVKAGDKVITQAFNFIATVEAIKDIGAIPVVINCDETLNMDPDELNSELENNKVSAVICVNMLGISCELDEIIKICRSFNVPLIEDACESIGATYDGSYCGTKCDVGVFSFDHGKMIACGEGGMILTNNKNYFKYCYEYHDHGHENNPKLPKGKDTRTIFGFNYRMTELQAAVAKVQLLKLRDMLVENQKRAEILLGINNEKIKFRKVPAKCTPTHDTIMITASEDVLEKIVTILSELKMGTKNVPDAMEWHCAYYWDHILDDSEISKIEKTKELLMKYVAIPIFLKKDLSEYLELAKRIEDL